MNHADARRSPPRGHEPTQAAKGRPAWRTWSLRVLTLVFFVVVGALVMHQLRTMEWATVGQALRSYRIGTLALAASLGLCSYAVYACYELMARRYSGHRLPIWLTAAVGVISYSFNLNLGVWLGGIGFRYRLYSQLGVDTPTTAKLYASTLVTNWSGYLALAGAVFTLYGLDLPPQWKLSDMGLRWIGALLLVAATGWLLACWCSPRREWALRGHAIALPPGRMAAAQMALGCANWSLMAGVVYVLLPHVPSGAGLRRGARRAAAGRHRGRRGAHSGRVGCVGSRVPRAARTPRAARADSGRLARLPGDLLLGAADAYRAELRAAGGAHQAPRERVKTWEGPAGGGRVLFNPRRPGSWENVAFCWVRS
jgi:uncharacterized membrane protein YbhN (UPF0104 family)